MEETTWSCAACTFLNPTRLRRCSVCGERRPCEASSSSSMSKKSITKKSTSIVEGWLRKRKSRIITEEEEQLVDPMETTGDVVVRPMRSAQLDGKQVLDEQKNKKRRLAANLEPSKESHVEKEEKDSQDWITSSALVARFAHGTNVSLRLLINGKHVVYDDQEKKKKRRVPVASKPSQESSIEKHENKVCTSAVLSTRREEDEECGTEVDENNSTESAQGTETGSCCGREDHESNAQGHKPLDSTSSKDEPKHKDETESSLPEPRRDQVPRGPSNVFLVGTQSARTVDDGELNPLDKVAMSILYGDKSEESAPHLQHSDTELAEKKILQPINAPRKQIYPFYYSPIPQESQPPEQQSSPKKKDPINSPQKPINSPKKQIFAFYDSPISQESQTPEQQSTSKEKDPEGCAPISVQNDYGFTDEASRAAHGSVRGLFGNTDVSMRCPINTEDEKSGQAHGTKHDPIVTSTERNSRFGIEPADSADPSVGFHTAGSGSAVTVSLELMEKADNFLRSNSGLKREPWSKSNNISVSRSRPPQPPKAGVSGKQFGSSECAGLSHDGTVQSEAGSGAPFFSTAGRQQKIEVLPSSLAKARSIFSHGQADGKQPDSSGSHDTVQPEAISATPFFSSAGRRQKIKVLPSSLARASNILSKQQQSHGNMHVSANKNPSCPMAQFQTAGKKKPIFVLDSSREKTNRLLREDRVASSVQQTADFSTRSDGLKARESCRQQNPASAIGLKQYPRSLTAPHRPNPGMQESANREKQDLIKEAAVVGRGIRKTETIQHPRGLSFEKSNTHNAQEGADGNGIPTTDPSGKSTISFHTAGRGCKINVSTEGLKKANALLQPNATSAARSNSKTFPSSGRHTVAVARFKKVHSRGKVNNRRGFSARPSHVKTNLTQQGKHAGTSAAGRHKRSLSAADPSRASSLLKESSRSSVAGGRRDASDMNGQNRLLKGREGIAPSNKVITDDYSACHDLGGVHMQENSTNTPRSELRTPVSFQTAGQGTRICVSDVDLAKASSLLNATTTSMSSVVGSQRDAIDRTEQSKLSSGIHGNFANPQCEERGTPVSFQTAGRGTKISVSTADLARASSFLNAKKSNASSIVRGRANPFHISEQSKPFGAQAADRARYPQPNKVTDNKYACSSGGVHDNNANAAREEMRTPASFQTAGRGTKIVVSTQDLAKASRLLKESTCSATERGADVRKMPKEARHGAPCLLQQKAPILQSPHSDVPITVPETTPLGRLSESSSHQSKRHQGIVQGSSFPCTAGNGDIVHVSSAHAARTCKMLAASCHDKTEVDGSAIFVASAGRSRDRVGPVGILRSDDSKLGGPSSKTRRSVAFDANTHDSVDSRFPRISQTPDIKRHPPVAESSNQTPSTGANSSVSKLPTIFDDGFTPLPGLRCSDAENESTMVTPGTARCSETPGDCIQDDSQYSVPRIRFSAPSSGLKLQAGDQGGHNVASYPESPSMPFEKAFASGSMLNTNAALSEFGVSQTTQMISSCNASTVRFDVRSKRPVFGWQHPNPLEGSNADYMRALIDLGCGSRRLDERWIACQARWIIWKLACTERRFAQYLGGKCLTFRNVVKQLHKRYTVEIIEGNRSCVRKLLNRDVPASLMMVVCVARIELEDNNAETGTASRPPGSDVVVLEVTDGWYSLRCCGDGFLRHFASKGKIRVGTKLLLSSAMLQGFESGVDPLDDAFDPFDKTRGPTLCITANGTRIARWDAKLGRVPRTKEFMATQGRLLTRNISHVLDGGGCVPLLDVTVVNRYPLMFLEKRTNEKSKILSERQEMARVEQGERLRQQLIDKHIDAIQTECEEEVDEDAPDCWRKMMKFGFCGEALSELDPEERNELNRWRGKRSLLLQRRIKQEVEAKLEELDFSLTKSVPFIRVSVVDYLKEGDKVASNAALLTVWSPSEDHFSMLKEGSSLRLHNIGTSFETYEGQRQFTVRKGSSMSPLPKRVQNTSRSLVFDIFSLRCPLTKLKQGSIVDAIVAITTVTKRPKNDGLQIVATDSTGLPMEILVAGDVSNSCTRDVLRLTAATTTEVVGFQKLVLRSLRPAVLDYGMGSSFDGRPHCQVSNRLREWVGCNHGKKIANQVSAFAAADIPKMVEDLQKCPSVVGFVADFRFVANRTLVLLIDTGGGAYQHCMLPLTLMCHLDDRSNDLVVFRDGTESDFACRSRFGSVLRARQHQYRYRFALIKTKETIPGCTMEISGVVHVDAKALAELYASKL